MDQSRATASATNSGLGLTGIWSALRHHAPGNDMFLHPVAHPADHNSIVRWPSMLARLIAGEPTAIEWWAAKCSAMAGPLGWLFPVETGMPEAGIALRDNRLSAAAVKVEGNTRTLSFPAPRRTALIHLVAEIKTQMTGELRLMLQLADGSDLELLRFRENGMRVAGHFGLDVQNRDIARLYSLVLREDSLTLYLDGFPLHWRAMPIPAFRGVQLRLRSEDGINHLAAVQLLTATDADALYDNDGAILAAMQRDMIETKSVSELWLLRTLWPAIAAPAGDAALAAFLDHMRVAGGEAVPELYDDFAGIVAKEGALPPLQPVVQIERLTMSLPKNSDEAISFANLIGLRKTETFRVLDNINFQAFTGDIIGVIGHNGAGKTTMLRALTGALPITGGRIRLAGRALLLRPGMGMRDDLSGRQNVILSSLYMGMSRFEIGAMLPQIIEFAELEDAIDRPIKYYSDGMRARLIFSLATMVSADILLLDELLGAGDIGFLQKAERRLKEMLRRSGCVILVTHNIGYVRTDCTKALYLQQGQVAFAGHPAIACEMFTADATY